MYKPMRSRNGLDSDPCLSRESFSCSILGGPGNKLVHDRKPVLVKTELRPNLQSSLRTSGRKVLFRQKPGVLLVLFFFFFGTLRATQNRFKCHDKVNEAKSLEMRWSGETPTARASVRLRIHGSTAGPQQIVCVNSRCCGLAGGGLCITAIVFVKGSDCYIATKNRNPVKLAKLSNTRVSCQTGPT